MSINYHIEAEVVDIRSTVPRSDDIFLVDSCVWIWMTYSNASHDASPYQINEYPNFIKAARLADAQLLRCGLSLAELAYRIERIEWKLFCNPKYYVTRKEYRHNDKNRRADVLKEIQTAWNTVKTLADPIDICVDEATTDATLKTIALHPIDSYDSFILKAMENGKVVQILTDDGDFTTIPNIKVFTANNTAIQAAINQGKLITR